MAGKLQNTVLRICLYVVILFVARIFIMSTFSYSSINIQRSNLPLCPLISPELKGEVSISTKISLAEAEKVLSDNVTFGGYFEPQTCRSRWRIAIVVPYRNREKHLGPFHHHMHRFLQKQLVSYAMFLVNQTDTKSFNRAKLFNVGFNEILQISHFDCFVFHDVDFLPDNDKNLYHCSQMPRHMTVSYAHPYRNEKEFERYFGGVVMLTKEHLQLINGWSNRFWGWGGEDDDLKRRIDMHDLPVWRYPKSIGTYQMLHHDDATKNPDRYKLLNETKSVASKDGLNSLTYKLLEIKKHPLFTVINADIS